MDKLTILTLIKSCNEEIEQQFVHQSLFKQVHKKDIVDTALNHVVKSYNLGRKESLYDKEILHKG